MKEIILCKYGEIILKGANKVTFEDMLCKDLRHKAKLYGNFSVSRAQSTIYIEPLDDDADIDGMFDAAGRVFGIIALCRAAVCEKNMDSIRSVAASYLPKFLAGHSTFKVEGKRSDKSFPLGSMEIAADIGGVVLSTVRGIKVDVHEPDITVRVEIREKAAYIHAGQTPGAGGLPVGSSGTGLLLLSGGIDSPVAGWMMSKRGVRIEAVHFESFPYTSERAKEKVLELASIVARYTGSFYVHIVSLTHIQEELCKNCCEDYFTLLLRRYMMKIASRIATDRGHGALITGESLGQVASQTMPAMAVTENAAEVPILRPCVGLDKEEIIKIARKIGTFDTSILPYEDCCTVFTPKHPRTKPELAKVLAEENKLAIDALVAEALAGVQTVRVMPKL